MTPHRHACPRPPVRPCAAALQSVGQDIIVVGLVVQIGFFVAFLALTTVIVMRPRVYHLDALPGDGGKRVVGALLSTIALMLVRNM